jgi:hypothetical protein
MSLSTLRYDPSYDDLMLQNLGFGLHVGMDNDFSLGSGFAGGFDGGFGSLFGGGLRFGPSIPERNDPELPRLNLTNWEEEDEAPGNNPPSSSAAPPAVACPRPKPAWRRQVAAVPVMEAAPNPPERLHVHVGDERDGEGGSRVEGGTMWEKQDTERWPEELRKAFEGFARGKSWGGEKWENCVTELIALERAWAFPSKGLLAVPNSAEDRLGEVEKFMRYGCKWGSRMELSSEVGPCTVKESFTGRWWDWWALVQPEGCKSGDGEMQRADEVAREEWEKIGKMAGRNGVLLYVGALLWWGKAAAAAPEAEKLLDD